MSEEQPPGGPEEPVRTAARERVETARGRAVDARGRAAERVEKARLSVRQTLGLDRSAGPPPETLAGHPWNPWTIPNAIGFVRLALIPVFVVIALGSDDGRNATAATIYAVVAWTDYADGMVARLTGQYSRFGALLDPFVDRLLVISGVVVCFHFDLLPRWALIVLIARETFMLGVARYGLKRGVDLRINWFGRAGVWPTMAAIFAPMVGLLTLGEVMLYIGLVMMLAATAQYIRDGRRQAREIVAAPSS